MASVKCCCVGKKHVFVATGNKPVCGCIGPGFIQSAKHNHYCALIHAGKDPEKYRETVLTLGRYHCRDIHQWEGGSCSFHPLVKCSCKSCKTDEEGFYDELKCPGERYHSIHVLKCEFHALAYQIECEERAKEAEKVIDPGLGKGHSNLPESQVLLDNSPGSRLQTERVNIRWKGFTTEVPFPNFISILWNESKQISIPCTSTFIASDQHKAKQKYPEKDMWYNMIVCRKVSLALWQNYTTPFTSTLSGLQE